MSAVDNIDDKPFVNPLKSFDQAQVGAALPKLFAASVGDMVVVISPAHKHRSLADIAWMALPPVSAGPSCMTEAANHVDAAASIASDGVDATQAYLAIETIRWWRHEDT